MARILIVDDEPSLLKMLQVNLELEGHETLLAGDGETALKRIAAEAPDLVLLDIMMPVLDGWEVLRRLQLSAGRKQPRVIVMTAKAGGHDVVKGLELGADEYVTKPFDMDDLLALIVVVLSRSDEASAKRRRSMIEERS